VLLGRRIQVVEPAKPEVRVGLSESRAQHDDRAVGNLTALARVYGGVLLAEDLLGAIALVEAAEPELRAVRQLLEAVHAMRLGLDPRKTLAHDLRKRVEPHRRAQRVGVVPDEQVTRVRRAQPAHDHRAREQERLAGARTSDAARVRLRPGHHLRRLELLRREVLNLGRGRRLVARRVDGRGVEHATSSPRRPRDRRRTCARPPRWTAAPRWR
jgi:hypothetical protein